MVLKGIAVCLALAALAMVDQCNALQPPHPQRLQKPGAPPTKFQAPKGGPPILQTKVGERPIHWSYPLDPVDPPMPEAPVVPTVLIETNFVAIFCRESVIQVQVLPGFYGGELKSPSELTLGSCQAVAFDAHTHSVIFTSDLQECGSNLRTNHDYLIYNFTLMYNPQPTGAVVRAVPLTLLLECHYRRRHTVSSLPLDPLFTPFSVIKVSGERLYFSLDLKTEDFQYHRLSNIYYIGELIHLEATVKQFKHTPLRVFVDHCYASSSPGSPPEYFLIENFGCFVDAQITGSSSQFLPRVNDVTLRFQLEAFRLRGSPPGDLVYITCLLRATSAAVPIGSQNRACSWIRNQWFEASGVHDACDSCGPRISAPKRKSRSLPAVHREVVEWETTITLDPIRVVERKV
ncbi:unnamed protein product [Boreogadus saida]